MNLISFFWGGGGILPSSSQISIHDKIKDVTYVRENIVNIELTGWVLR